VLLLTKSLNTCTYAPTQDEAFPKELGASSMTLFTIIIMSSICLSLVSDVVNVLVNQWGLNFIIPAIIIIIVAYVATDGKTYIPLALGVLGGALCVIVLPQLGINLNTLF